MSEICYNGKIYKDAIELALYNTYGQNLNLQKRPAELLRNNPFFSLPPQTAKLIEDEWKERFYFYNPYYKITESDKETTPTNLPYKIWNNAVSAYFSRWANLPQLMELYSRRDGKTDIQEIITGKKTSTASKNPHITETDFEDNLGRTSSTAFSGVQATGSEAPNTIVNSAPMTDKNTQKNTVTESWQGDDKTTDEEERTRKYTDGAKLAELYEGLIKDMQSPLAAFISGFGSILQSPDYNALGPIWEELG